MPIFHHDVAQYSEVYDRLTLGIPTSSHFQKIITLQGKPSKQWREYACVLIAERILQRKIEFYNLPAMERGLIVEAEAADWYEFDQDVTVQRVGFITDDNHKVGCFRPQLQGQLYVSQRSWVDIVCWHDVLPKVVMRLSRMRSSSTPSTANCRSSTSLLSLSWKRPAPRMRGRSHKGDWRCRRRYEQVWRLSREGEVEFSLLRIS
jgi:YqaJ-like viral recombinase domain